MEFFRRIFWLVWFWIIVFLVVTFVNYQIYGLILFLMLFILTGISVYLHESHKKSFLKIKKREESINLKPVKEEVKKEKKPEDKFFRKISRLEIELDQYKLEQEKKYRDVVRKVLDVDNKLNKKFKLLGESIIKISKEKRKIN